MDKLKLIQALLEGEACSTERRLPFEVGEKVYIRTVTHHQTGRIKEIVGPFIVLEDAAWIGDSGRWMDALKTGELNEVEPVFHPMRVNSEAIIDVCVWDHPLPREQK